MSAADVENEVERENARGEEEEGKPTKICCSVRLLFIIMCFFALLNVAYVRVGVSMALICMVRPTSKVDQKSLNFLSPEHETKETVVFDWSAATQGYLLSSVFYGLIIGPCVAGFLSFKFGGKIIFVVGTLSVGITNLLVPEAAKLTPYLFFAVRVLTGFFGGFVFPAFYDLVSHWVVAEERQLLVTGALVSIPFASIIHFPVSGLLCNCCGWAWVFYALSIWVIICGIVFNFTVFNYPEQCRFITKEELQFLTSRIPKLAKPKIPWKFISRSLPIYAYITMHFCMNYVYLTIIFSLPFFLSKVLKITIQENSLLSAIPFVGSFLMRILLSLFFEQLRLKLRLSKNALRKIFISIGAILVSCFLLVITLVNQLERYWVVGCFVLAMSSMELCLTGGYLTSLLDLCPSYANILTGIANTVGNSAGLICPVINGLITVNGTREEFHSVYYVAISLLLSSTTFYLAFGQNSLQKWGIANLPLANTDSRTSFVT